jgi:hypothetical protein
VFHAPDRDRIRPLGTRRVTGGIRSQTDSASRHAWPLWGPITALVAGWIVMAWPWLSGRVTIPWDAKAQFLPQIQFLAQSLARGESPFWAPYVFSGQNQIADPQSMIFSAPFLLLAAVNGNPSAWAVDMTTLLAGLAGAIALLIWFRDQGWHWAGGVLAGLVFCFGASMAWRLQHVGQVLSLAYWPMALLALDRVLQRRSYLAAVALGMLGASILLGRDQIALLVLYLLAAFTVWRILSADTPWVALRQSVLPLGASGFIAAALAVLPLMMTALLAGDSNRPSIDLEGAGRGSLHPALLVTAVIPHLFGAAFRMEDYWGPPSFAWSNTGLYIAQNMGQIYVGAVPLLLIAMAAVRGHLWAREVRFFTVALAVASLYALGWYTPAFRVLYTLLPGISLYRRPADATFLMGALAAVLAGYALHRVFQKPWETFDRRAWVTAAGIVLFAGLAAAWLAVRLERTELLLYPFVAAGTALVAAVAVLVVAQQRIALEPWAATLLFCGVTAIDLGWNNGPSSSSGLPSAAYDVLNPKTKDPVIAILKQKVAAGRTETRRDRVELLGLGFHWPNASLTHRLENTLGYNPVRHRLYSQATGADDAIGLPDQRKFSPLLPSYTSPLIDHLGLRYVATGAPLESIDKSLRPGAWQLINKTDTAWIYENPRALPRVSFARQIKGANFSNMLLTGEWPQFDPATTVLLDGVQSAYYSSGGALGGTSTTVRIVAYHHTFIEIEATSATGGYVVLNDIWHPWWFATVDGVPAKMERANVIFRAVEVPSATRKIRFEFHPLRGAWNQLRGVK